MHVIPRFRASTIPRHQLLESLQRWPDVRLICITAPAGYGKSTLAAGWIRSLAALPHDQQPGIAWLSLIEPLDAERCLHNLIQALLPIVPALQAISHLDGSGHYTPLQRIRMVCTELAAAAHPLILVVDDYQFITDPAAQALFQHLLDDAPENFHLVLVSRTFPALRINDLILDDALLTLTEHDLALNHDEFLAFVQLIGMDWQPPAVLDALEQRCNGWIAGLKLLVHGSQRTRSLTTPSELSGSALLQFIESRILATMPAPLRDFARQGAQMPWMSADLMAAVVGASSADCAHMLADLVASNAFVVEFESPTGEVHFRFHPLVQEALRNADNASSYADARRRATAWFLENNDADSALNALGPVPFPAELTLNLSRTVRGALRRFDLASAQRWLAALPATLLEIDASLAVAAAWTEFFAESLPQFKATLARAIGAVQRSLPGPDFEELRVDAAILSVYRHLLDNETDAAARELAVAEALPRTTDSLGSGYILLMRSLVPRHLQGASSYADGIQLLQEAATIFERIGHDHGVIAMLFSTTLLKMRHADFNGALASSIFLQGFAQQHGLIHLPHVQENLCLYGQILYLLDRVPEAREVLNAFLKRPIYGENQADNDYIARLYLQLCAAAEAPDPAASLRNIDAVEDASSWVDVLGLEFSASHGLVAWPRILRDHRAGQPERCRQTAESLRIGLTELDNHTQNAIRMAVLASAVLSNDDSPHLDAQLENFRAHLEATHFPYLALQAHLLQVVHAHRRGDAHTAVKRLHMLLPEIERCGAHRLLLDFPELQHLVHDDLPNSNSQVIAAQPVSSPDFDLTRQEVRILNQLADDLSTKEIAAAHSLSKKTIYGHIHRIFKKLRVHNREDAMRIWRSRQQ